MTHGILVTLFGLLLLPGVMMSFVPMLPAFWYLIACAAAFGIVDSFTHLTLGNFGVLIGIFLLSIAVDHGAGLLGAKFGGAAWKSLLYGALGGIIGLFLFPPLGIFLGLFVGVLLAELLRQKDQAKAVRAATGALIGSLAGVVINVTLAFAFVILFVLLALQ